MGFSKISDYSFKRLLEQKEFTKIIAFRNDKEITIEWKETDSIEYILNLLKEKLADRFEECRIEDIAVVLETELSSNYFGMIKESDSGLNRLEFSLVRVRSRLHEQNHEFHDFIRKYYHNEYSRFIGGIPERSLCDNNYPIRKYRHYEMDVYVFGNRDNESFYMNHNDNFFFDSKAMKDALCNAKEWGFFDPTDNIELHSNNINNNNNINDFISLYPNIYDENFIDRTALDLSNMMKYDETKKFVVLKDLTTWKANQRKEKKAPLQKEKFSNNHHQIHDKRKLCGRHNYNRF